MTVTMTTEELDRTTEIMKRTAAENVARFGVSEREGFEMACERLNAEHPEVFLYWGIATIARERAGV